MASWKKVIVSGSSAALTQLTVDTDITASGIISSSGQIVANDINLSGDISVTQITASIISASTSLEVGTIVNDSTVADSRLTGSFTGSFVGTFTNPDGSALEAEWDGTRDGNSEITGSGTGPSLVLSGSTGTDLDVKNDAIIGGDLAVSGNITGSIISASNSLITSTIVNDSTVADSRLTGSFTGSFVGTFTNPDGSALEAEWDGTRDGNSEITGSGAGPTLVLSGSTDIDLRVLNNAVISGSLHATTFEPTGSGDLTVFSTVGNSDLTIGASDTTVKVVSDLIELGNGAGDLVDIKGDFRVAGTASFTHATNLDVADKYILLNSGSSGANSDSGGIVIQGPNQDIGDLCGYVSGSSVEVTGINRRWGIASNFNADTAGDFVADAFMSTVMLSGVEGGTNPDLANDLYKKPGNIFIDQSSGIPYIYV